MRTKLGGKFTPLTQEQIDRAVEMQKKAASRKINLPAQQNWPLPITSYWQQVLWQEKDRFLRWRMTFEEKYGIETPKVDKTVTSVEFSIKDMPKEEDEPVPPSLEELEESVEKTNENDNIEMLKTLTLKWLKEEYKNRWGKKWVARINNKQEMIDLIINLWPNGKKEK